MPNGGESEHEHAKEIDHDKGKDIGLVQRGTLDPKQDVYSQDDDEHRGPA